MRRILVITLSFLLFLPACAQHPWEEALADLASTASDDDTNWEELYDVLWDLEQHPVRLTRTGTVPQ